MQTSLIIMLMICMTLAIQGYYFGFVNPPRGLAWLQQGTFVIMVFLIMPFLLAILYFQSGSMERLAEKGFKPHPSIEESIGFGNGMWDDPVWVFKVNGSKDEIRDFYMAGENTTDWSLKTDRDVMMIFERGDESMTVAYREGWKSRSLVFMLDED